MSQARTAARPRRAGGISAETMTSNGGPLFEKYPVNTTWELMLEGSDQAVTGRIYTTDEASGVVVLQSALAHTTLATEMRVIQASSIKEAKIVEETEEEKAKNPPLVLPKVQKKALEEREKRALKMAEESLRHINQKVRSHALSLLFENLRCFADPGYLNARIFFRPRPKVKPFLIGSSRRVVK